jgi:hypothetical protein
MNECGNDATFREVGVIGNVSPTVSYNIVFRQYPMGLGHIFRPVSKAVAPGVGRGFSPDIHATTPHLILSRVLAASSRDPRRRTVFKKCQTRRKCRFEALSLRLVTGEVTTMNSLKGKNELVGSWILTDGRVVGDEKSDLIRELTEKRLRRIAVALSGWETLYQDPEDGRFWELHYPHGALQGGGPMALRVLDIGAAKLKYGALLNGG